LQELESGQSDDAAIVARLQQEPKLKELRTDEEKPRVRTSRFSTDVKSATYIRDAIDTPVRCALCGARLHKEGISTDHARRREEGGFGTEENAQLTHPYCNTGYKEQKHARARRTANA
jgi:5-methylcytosine-specific restriction endonuclease McrA